VVANTSDFSQQISCEPQSGRTSNLGRTSDAPRERHRARTRGIAIELVELLERAGASVKTVRFPLGAKPATVSHVMIPTNASHEYSSLTGSDHNTALLTGCCVDCIGCLFSEKVAHVARSATSLTPINPSLALCIIYRHNFCGRQRTVIEADVVDSSGKRILITRAGIGCPYKPRCCTAII
jgi:hypothetical protein